MATQRIDRQFFAPASPEEQKIREKMATHPRFPYLLKQLTAEYGKDYAGVSRILSQMLPGTRFKETGLCRRAQNTLMNKINLLPDQETGLNRTFKFFAPSIPYKSPVFAHVVMEEIGKPYSQTADPYIIFHDDVPEGGVAAFYTVTMKDFIANFVIGEWELIDEIVMQEPDDVAEEKDVLRPVPMSAEMLNKMR